MHGHHLVEEVGRHGPRLGPEKLEPHHHRLGPADHEKDQGHEDVHDADLLVIDRRNPLVKHRGPRGAFEGHFRFRDRHAAGRPESRTASTNAFTNHRASLLQSRQVIDDLVDLLFTQSERGHQAAFLRPPRIDHPLA